ncbi:MAG: electron transfer flavoprotein subunit beta/FixA family protein [Elusimicrobiota bacterium]
MALHIVVCVKRTPASTSVAVDSATGKVRTEGLPHGMNPQDEYAVEEALRIKEKNAGSRVSVLSAGGPESDEVIRTALALGCDEGALLSAPAFTGSDTLGTSHILAKAVEKLGKEKAPVSLVLFGKQSNDGESGLTAGETAAWLGWPSVSFVRRLPAVTESEVTAERLMEDGIETLKLKLPAVVSVTKEINEPRLPSLRGKMAAKKAPVSKWGAAELGTDASVTGSAGAGIEWGRLSPVPSRPSGTLIPGETPEEKARNLADKLKEAKLL